MFLREEKFIVKHVGQELETEHGTAYRDIVLIKPAYTDEFGEKRGTDDVFSARAFGDKVSKLTNLAYGDKVTATLILNGKETIDNSKGIFYNTYLNLWKIEKL